MPFVIDPQTLCANLKGYLAAASGIGLVSDRPGGVMTWVKRPRPEQAYWEIEVLSNTLTHTAAGTDATESLLIQVEGFMPWSYEHPNTTATWRTLLQTVLDTLLARETLGDNLHRRNLPQLITNDRVEVSPGGSGEPVLCHHAVVQFRAERDFTYTTS